MSGFHWARLEWDHAIKTKRIFTQNCISLKWKKKNDRNSLPSSKNQARKQKQNNPQNNKNNKQNQNRSGSFK